MEAEWDTHQEEHEVYFGVEDATKKLTSNAYDLCWLEEIEDNVLDFTHKPAFQIMNHLLSQCINLTNREKPEKLKNTELPWLADENFAIYSAKFKKEQAKLKKMDIIWDNTKKSHMPSKKCTIVICSTSRN